MCIQQPRDLHGNFFATSRRPLHLSAEYEHEVPPLELPDDPVVHVAALVYLTDRALLMTAGPALSGSALDGAREEFRRACETTPTIADLDASENIDPRHLSEAIQYRTLDRSYWS